MIAERLKNAQPPTIMQLVQKAKQLKAEGHPVIDLGIGEPDFNTPDHIKRAAFEAIENNLTRYTIVAGEAELREAIARKFERENSLRYSVEEISVASGAKQAIYNTMMATVSAGDEVIIPSPYWPSYADIVSLCEGTPVAVPCSHERRFAISAEQLEQAITPNTKWLFLNSPSNPTGGVYSAEALEQIAAVLERHSQVHVISDDIYEHLIFEGAEFVSILNVAPQLRERTVLVNGVSKAFSMTGWRIGYSAGPKQLIDGINTIQGQSTTHACSVSQAAALAALNGPTDFMADRAAVFERRSKAVVAALAQTQILSVMQPQGTFYVFPGCHNAIGKATPSGQRLANDIDVCNWLLESHHVSTVPGTAFGLSHHLRLSTAASDADLTAACERIAQACNGLKD